MPQTHKLVRDAVTEAMRASFNDALAAALPAYGVNEAVILDWDSGSSAVTYARLAAGDIAVSDLKGRLTLQIAPDGSQWTGETRGIKWSGIVGIRLIFRLRYSYRDLDDNPPEDSVVVAVAEAIEDAVIEVFQQRGYPWPKGLVYAKPPDCPEGYVFEELSDGSQVTVPISIGFKVDATY